MGKKWCAVWGTSPSYACDGERNYAKDITLRYGVMPTLDGEKIRITFSNLTGIEDVCLSKVCVMNSEEVVNLTFGGKSDGKIKAGENIISDEAEFKTVKGEKFYVSIYLKDFTDMHCGNCAGDPIFTKEAAMGDFAEERILPIDKKKSVINNIYFMETVEILASADSKTVIAFGDSITAQSWPEQLQSKILEENIDGVSVIRRATSGSRVLRQYLAYDYLPYGLTGVNRIKYELDTSGASDVVVLHGINDIIHPDGINPFRPMCDLPSANDLINGYRVYIEEAHKRGLKIHFCTVLPFMGWGSYTEEKDEIRKTINNWIRTNTEADGFIDLDKELRDKENELALKETNDSGDHLHPSYEGAGIIAETVKNYLFK